MWTKDTMRLSALPGLQLMPLLMLAALSACESQDQQSAATPPAADAFEPGGADAASPYDALPEAVRQAMDKPFTTDLDDMVKRRTIRMGVTYNRTHYFVDKGQERGLTYESAKLFESELNTGLKTGNLKVHVVMVPMSRDQLYPALTTGKIDMVAAMVNVRPEAEKACRIFDSDAHQGERGRRDWSGGSAIGERGRSVRQRGLLYGGRASTTNPQQPERAVESTREGSCCNRRSACRARRR